MFVIITIILITSLMIGLNALYVAGEFAAVSARKTRIAQMASQNNRLAKFLLPILEDHHKLDNYIAASQVGITISSVVLGIYGQQQIAPLLAPYLANLPFLTDVAAAGVSTTLVLILFTTLQVVLGELVPKSLALQYPERVALATTIPMRWSADIILKPLIVILNGSGVLIMRLLGIDAGEGHKHVHSPEEIKFLIGQSHQGGLLDEQEHQMLDNAFRFGKLRAGEIVIPRTKMIAANVSTPVNDVLRLAGKDGLTRIPIYENDIDHIVGFVHLKELFQLAYKSDTTDIRPILRDVTFVLETARLDDVWNTLNQEQSYLAIVFDEYGGTVGLITREDLLEELFGDVQDEFDGDEMTEIKKLDENRYRVLGEAAITHLNEVLPIFIDSGTAFTVGGFFVNQLGHLPEIGEEITVDNVRLKATKIADKTLEELILTIEKPETQATEDEA